MHLILSSGKILPTVPNSVRFLFSMFKKHPILPLWYSNERDLSISLVSSWVLWKKVCFTPLYILQASISDFFKEALFKLEVALCIRIQCVRLQNCSVYLVYIFSYIPFILKISLCFYVRDALSFCHNRWHFAFLGE